MTGFGSVNEDTVNINSHSEVLVSDEIGAIGMTTESSEFDRYDIMLSRVPIVFTCAKTHASLSKKINFWIVFLYPNRSR